MNLKMMQARIGSQEDLDSLIDVIEKIGPKASVMMSTPDGIVMKTTALQKLIRCALTAYLVVARQIWIQNEFLYRVTSICNRVGRPLGATSLMTLDSVAEAMRIRADELKAERDLVDRIQTLCEEAGIRPDLDIVQAIYDHKEKRS